MSFSSRPRRQTRRSSDGPPAWFVILIALALVFGAFYILQGVQNFFNTGGQGVIETTQLAQGVSTATAGRATRVQSARETTALTPRATSTPVPECKDFRVIVPNAIVREEPAGAAAILTSYNENEIVCVLQQDPGSEWYTIDMTPGTRRLDFGYMHQTVVRAVNPTPTPSVTPTLAPTITPLPTDQPTQTPTRAPTRPTETPNADFSPTPSQTPLPPPPTPTLLLQGA